jgi:hypothetical protein
MRDREAKRAEIEKIRYIIGHDAADAAFADVPLPTGLLL